MGHQRRQVVHEQGRKCRRIPSQHLLLRDVHHRHGVGEGLWAEGSDELTTAWAVRGRRPSRAAPPPRASIVRQYPPAHLIVGHQHGGGAGGDEQAAVHACVQAVAARVAQGLEEEGAAAAVLQEVVGHDFRRDVGFSCARWMGGGAWRPWARAALRQMSGQRTGPRPPNRAERMHGLSTSVLQRLARDRGARGSGQSREKKRPHASPVGVAIWRHVGSSPSRVVPYDHAP